MHALLQRVRHARVEVEGETVGSIEQGLLVLLCAEPEDTTAIADRLLEKILRLRVFADAEGKMNHSLQQLNDGVGGGLLIISQFTLAADTRKGTRPGFSRAAPPALAERLYRHFTEQAQRLHSTVQTGRFAADMQVHLQNDGPVTIPMRVTA